MSHLADKSDSNLICANLLHEEEHYAASIHCSYYSLFQRMKSVLKEELGLSENEYIEEVAKIDNNSHIALSKMFCVEYMKKVQDVRKKESFYSQISDLKTRRTKADYKDIEMTLDDSLKSYKASRGMQNHIKNIFTPTTT